MKIKSIVPMFGGKRTMGRDIVRELGDHHQFFDPFCGSMSVLFAKEPSKQETVNDLHAQITNLARVLQREYMAEDLYNRLIGTIVCEGILDDTRDYLESTELNGENMLEQAYNYFIASWMGRGGTAGTERIDYQIAVRWTKGGGSPTTRFRNTVESIPAWHRRLLNVVVLQRDAFDILDRFEDADDTAIYIDCPYPPETRANLGKAGGGGGRYLHEFNHEASGLFGEKDDHTRLRDALIEYENARIVVSTYECQRYRDLYDGWTFRDMKRQKNLHVQNKRGAGQEDAPEVLILNGPSYAEAA